MTLLDPVLSSLLPAVLVVLYFVIGMLAFSLRSLLWGMPRDGEMEARGRSVLVGTYLRNYIVWVMRPLWLLVLSSGVSANTVTGLAALLGMGSGVAVALGHFALGGWLFLFSGILDVMDGRLARARGQVSPIGVAFDSVLDRYTDAAILLGLAWYFRTTWVLLPVLAAILGTSLVPYVRAKAESLGVSLKDGLMQRAERILYLGGAVALSPLVEALLPAPDPRPAQRLAAVGVLFLGITSNLTALGRLERLVGELRARAIPTIRTGNAAGPRAAARAAGRGRA
ncbi:MAG TPA: CDP-alcohol phosphatidyltransferase family protein [Polyangia bacterium]|nr:CDP-alcohol phosphatidyltransferase family protein [Polyangia bacterium]